MDGNWQAWFNDIGKFMRLNSTTGDALGWCRCGVRVVSERDLIAVGWQIPEDAPVPDNNNWSGRTS